MTRPPSFDAMLMKQYRLLHMFALRYEKDRDRRGELVNDTIVRALEKWANFREDGSFTEWLRHMMWQVITRRREAAGMKKRTGQVVSYGERAIARKSVPPTQESCAELAIMRDKVSGTRALSRLAEGMMQFEIAQELGLGQSRITQIVAQERAELFGMAA